MATAVGQTINGIITILDALDAPILGLEEIDFEILEAYLITLPATTAIVDLEEVDDGQYAYSFTPGTFGDWAFHYRYEDLPVLREETIPYQVSSSAEIVVIMVGGTWTYAGDLDDPAQAVRFLIQDTDGDHPQFTDAEVNYALGASAGVQRKAAAYLVERLMARYMAMADTTELDLSVRASQLYEHAKDLLRTLNNPVLGGISVRPYAGGISNSDVETNNLNPDRNQGVFAKTGFSWKRVP